MRQAILLCVGLFLITLWGIGLNSVLRRWRTKDAPERLPAGALARPLSEAPVNEAAADAVATSHGDSAVVQAAFQPPATEVVTPKVAWDENGDQRWRWNIQDSRSHIWLRGSNVTLEYEFESIPTGQPPSIDLTAPFQSGPVTLTWQGKVVSVPLDLSGFSENELRVVLRATAKTDGTFDFDLVVSPDTGVTGLRLHKPTFRGPYAPLLTAARNGSYYPWLSDLSLNVFRDRATRVGAQVRTYEQTESLVAIVLGIPADQSTPRADVLSVERVGVSASGQTTEMHSQVDFQELVKLDNYVKLEVAFAGVGIDELDNHRFAESAIQVLPTHDSTQFAAAVATIDQIAGRAADDTGRFYTSNQTGSPSATVSSSATLPDKAIACVLLEQDTPVSTPQMIASNKATFEALQLRDGAHHVTAVLYAGDTPLNNLAKSSQVDVRTGGFRVAKSGPDGFGSQLGTSAIRVEFTRPVAGAADDIAYSLLYSRSGQFTVGANYEPVNSLTATFDPLSNAILNLTAGNVQQGYYQLTIDGRELQDVFGNYLESTDGTARGSYVKRFGGAAQLASPQYPVTAGVNRGQAPFVEYPEFTAPRKSTKGFNPSDKVETRVSRLYFYRDAHRVAQILNRKVQSYNRQEVSARRQLADKARQEADSRTTDRQNSERAAVQAAQRTRELENQLSDTQRNLNSSLQQLQVAASQPVTDENREQQQQIVSQLERTARSFASQAEQLESQVRAARDAEVAANERWQQSQRQEDLARTDQFRLETAAGHADPDTFAAGDPTSVDPVAQVSISVIGEGLLHLRGPLKGVNQVRIMIDQIDAPQGQVRVNVHSTQINGDEADRLEQVANRIQTYIDQARFLTVQSGEMLRKAVIHVAATKVEQTRGMYGGATQAERDQLYLYSFFGRDFIDELRAMDSELLHTGNKLLSLHSMDVTSLSSALMLLALANNETRLAVLQEFQRLTQSDLAAAEQQYIHNGVGTCVGGCKPGCKHRAPPICLLAQNASFTSLRGFFDAQLAHADTMSPMQREMIRLAQILKARLVTEMEYKQRVMERAVIEERLGQENDQELQLRRESLANQQYQRALEAQLQARAALIANLPRATAELDAANYDSISRSANEFLSFVSELIVFDATPVRDSVVDPLYSVLNSIDSFRTVRQNTARDLKLTNRPGSTELVKMFGSDDQTRLKLLVYATRSAINSDGQLDDNEVILVGNAEERTKLLSQISSVLTELRSARSVLQPFGSDYDQTNADIDQLISGLAQNQERMSQFTFSDGDQQRGQVAFISIEDLRQATVRIIQMLKRWEINKLALDEAKAKLREFEGAYVEQLQQSRSDSLTLGSLGELLQTWSEFRGTLGALYKDTTTGNESWSNEVQAAVTDTDTALTAWVNAFSRLDAARAIAQDARRPLDHKKFLDMLIDDLEEKYIELLEGTRAHTANIDNYLKRLTTSLDDDFNTQFYNPIFRLVREASQFKRVEFGQTETTNVLANNREFAKVAPSATMEFDLPQRDILIAEGIDSALAIYNDVGALVNDPNLLALAKMQSGSSVANAAAGTLGGRGAVRNVLPGLQGDTAEQLIAQNAGSGPEFESNVEKLIPDPAVYKFETGTGYEIRPVIAPDGQAVVFDFHYLYTTQIREPVRADEKHLGRVKQHFIDTDVQLSNFELREVSRYVVALKAERTANGVPLLEDIPVVGALWRPLPNREKSLQQNIIMAQATIFPTLFDLMGLRWAPAVSDLDPLRLSNREYLVRGRHRFLENRIYDYSSSRVDEFLRIPEDVRRADLYRSQESIPSVHPNGYRGPGLDYENSRLREGYDPEEAYAHPGYIPSRSAEGAVYLPHRQQPPYESMPRGGTVLEQVRPMELAPPSKRPGESGIRQPQPPQLPADGSMRLQSDGWQTQSAR